MKEKTVLNWEPLTNEITLIPGKWYLLSNSYELDVGEYSIENGAGLFCVFGHYIERNNCNYEYIAEVYPPEV